MASWMIPVMALLAVSAVVAHPRGGIVTRPRPDLKSLGKDPLRCALCLEVMGEVYKIASSNKTVECLEDLVTAGCKILHIEDSTVCQEVIGEYGNIVAFVIENLLLDPKRFCGDLFDGCGGAEPPKPKDPWIIPMLNTTKPPRVKPVDPSPDKPKLRVVHLADLHFDKYYAEGSEVDCGEPLCCRQTGASTVKTPAGKWGTVAKCDVPVRTIENMFQHLASRTDWDYIIWTGDAPPHNVWDQSKDDQLTVQSTLNDLFAKYFSNRVLISAVGNHESAPANNYPPFSTPIIPDQYNVAWLFNAFANDWTKYGIGNDPDTIKSIQELASYVTKPYPGLRVISLNTMYGLSGNFWLYLDEVDPDNLLQWLMKQLQDAENAGDKVHIIGHVPPGDALKEWSANFYNIVNRYENTVTGLFYGHSHMDSYFLIYENGSITDPIQVGFVSPSGTVYDSYWPSFRIYTIDGNYPGSSYRVLDHETYMLNLDEANKSDDPKWELEYSAKDAYGLDTSLPDAWNDLIERFIQDDDLFQKYYRHKYRAPPSEPCTGGCKHSELCNIRSGRSHDEDNLCQGLPNKQEAPKTQFTQTDLESARLRVKTEFSILPKSCHI